MYFIYFYFSVNKDNELEEPKPTISTLSNTPSLYSQNVAKQSDKTPEEHRKDAILEASTNQTNDNTDNMYDHTSTIEDDESINNNNNNNNIKSTKKSQFVAIEKNTIDTTDNEVESPKEQFEESPFKEENKDLGYKTDFHHIQNGISDRFEVKDCEKEKYPKNHE